MEIARREVLFMIIKRVWESKKGINVLLGFCPKYTYVGYFLFGIIPIFINRESNY